MNHRLFVIVTTATALTLTFAAPALADDTYATVTVTTGALEITAPVAATSAPISLGSDVNTVSGTVISGTLGQVRVDDARGVAAGGGWVATAISTAFTPPAGPTIGAAQVGYTAGPITQVGTATYTANNPTNMTGVSSVLTATGITGSNSATWSPTINVRLPGNMAAGVYKAMITHSVA